MTPADQFSLLLTAIGTTIGIVSGVVISLVIAHRHAKRASLELQSSSKELARLIRILAQLTEGGKPVYDAEGNLANAAYPLAGTATVTTSGHATITAPTEASTPDL